MANLVMDDEPSDAKSVEFLFLLCDMFSLVYPGRGFAFGHRTARYFFFFLSAFVLGRCACAGRLVDASAVPLRCKSRK